MAREVDDAVQQKAIEFLFTIFTPGHRLDPEQRVQVDTMEQIARLMRKHREECAEPFEDIWREARAGKHPRGAVAISSPSKRATGCS